MSQAPDSAGLPNDLIEFLRAGRQLQFDADNSQIGHITLKRATELGLVTIMTFPGCQSIMEDPYSELEGQYQCSVYDLIAESENYDSQGLLCWFVALNRFGCIDPEHGDVITFPDATWADIVARPMHTLMHNGVMFMVSPRVSYRGFTFRSSLLTKTW